MARSVLSTVILAANPLSPSTIAILLGLDPEEVLPLLSSVNSLLIFKGDLEHPVWPFYKSFPDFITDPTQCTKQRFHISPPDHHSQLLVHCLNLMNKALTKNICKLPEAVANSDITDLKERTERYIDPALLCMFVMAYTPHWCRHSTGSGTHNSQPCSVPVPGNKVFVLAGGTQCQTLSGMPLMHYKPLWGGWRCVKFPCKLLV